MSREQSLVIKTIAILLLLFHHLNHLPDIPFLFSYISRFCVWLFVFVTAYGVTLQYKKRTNTIRFIIKRLLLLYIPFWIVYIIDFILIYFRSDLTEYKNVFYVVMDLLGLSYYFGTPSISGVFWYMVMISIMLILLPLFYWLVTKMDYWTIIVALLIVLFFPFKIKAEYGGQIDVYLPIFVSGICFAEKKDSKLFNLDLSKIGKVLLLVLSILVYFVVFYLVCFGIPGIPESFLGLLYSTIAFGLILVIVNCLKKLPDKDSKLYLIGKHSGNIYFIHITLYQYYIERFTHNPILMYFICLVISLAASIIIETIKKFTKFNDMIQKLANTIDPVKNTLEEESVEQK